VAASAILAACGIQIVKRETVLVRDVSLDVCAGAVVGVAGESGSGKTLTCRALAGVLPGQLAAQAGEVIFDGEPVPRRKNGWPALHGRAVTIFQEPRLAFNPVRSVRTHFDLVLRAAGVYDKERRAALMTEYLGHVQIGQPDRVLGSFAQELSGGMLQRVLVAMVLARRPKLIIADEPTSSLDAVVRRRVVDLILETKAEIGAALLLVTHDLQLLVRVCDFVYIMRGGEIVEQGTTQKLRHDPEHPYTRLLLQGLGPGSRTIARVKS
jgi:ABC-type dipeptide/oligopeptide/nickel transport system ATPase component